MKREKKLQNQLWKERMPLIASFFLPFFILTVICILHDVYPFGEQCILHIDMYHQYCPFFTEDIGGIFQVVFDEDGNLEFRTSSDENDLLYDEIGCGLKIRELQRTKEELLRALEMYYKVLYIGVDESEM